MRDHRHHRTGALALGLALFVAASTASAADPPPPDPAPAAADTPPGPPSGPAPATAGGATPAEVAPPPVPAAAPAASVAASDAAKAEPAPAPSAEPPASRSDLETLSAEVRRLKLELAIPDVQYKSFSGLGPAASKVYYAPKGLSIGGYGEATYQRFSNVRDASGNLLRDTADLRRMVLYAGYRFSDLIVVNTEFELEHARQAESEFAYIDFLFSTPFRLRTGLMLVPIGFVNEFHEPPFFNGVNRPDLETTLIPSTWRELGVGAHGEVAGLRYKLYFINGLNVAKLGATSAHTWMRDARGNGSMNAATSGAGVLNLGYDVGPLTVGATGYFGRAGQGLNVGGEQVAANVFLGEAHAQLSWRRLQVRGIYALGLFGDAGIVSGGLGLTGTQVIGSRARGGYVDVAYDVLGVLAPSSSQSASPFARFEVMNLQDDVPVGGSKNPNLDTWSITSGVMYRPHPNIVLKADGQYRQSQATAGNSSTTLSVGAGYIF